MSHSWWKIFSQTLQSLTDLDFEMNKWISTAMEGGVNDDLTNITATQSKIIDI